ncbi:MAG: hypothetical protein IPI67_21335 [Myxococcales bacterium]|nr:hypothetical protein [Myxococcales bacterium]
MTTPLRYVLWFCSVCALGACGGAAAPKAPGSTGQSVEQLADELEQAELALGRELGGLPAAQAGPADAAAGKPPTPDAEEKKPEDPAAPAPLPAQPAPTPTTEAAPSAPRSPCETACKALASMRRSQERICEIAGDEHERCGWAKKRVSDASERVEHAGCSCAS